MHHYPAAIPQCFEALREATSKRLRPIIATDGPMVRGVMNLRRTPSNPV